MLTNKKLILLLAVILLVSAIAGIAVLLTRSGGTQVVITVNGTEYAAYDLHTDRRVVIGPQDGSWHNTLEIKNGRAAIVESDCDNQICVHTPALTEDIVGLIVCLPHGLVAELRQP